MAAAVVQMTSSSYDAGGAEDGPAAECECRATGDCSLGDSCLDEGHGPWREKIMGAGEVRQRNGEEICIGVRHLGQQWILVIGSQQLTAHF